MLAERTSPVEENAAEIAGTATRFAPSYAGGYRLLGQISYDPNEAAGYYADAVRLSPFDIERRIDLGRALEQKGDIAGAEAQFRRAVELAPHYAAPRWHLANFLFRRQRDEEALRELQLAAAGSRRYREQAFSLVWDLYQKDAARIDLIAGDDPEALAHASYFLAARGSAEASLRSWDRLSPEQKNKNEKLARGIADGLYGQKKYPEARDLFAQLGVVNASEGAITNGSFESELGPVEDARFSWEIYRNEAKVEFSADNRIKRTGQRSLRTTFRGYAKPAFYNIAQTVSVRPNTDYRLTFWVRAENLQSAGTPFIEAADLINEKPLAASEPFAVGSYDWVEVRLDLRTPSNCTGISIRALRKFCGEDCPISGSFWLDDFELSEK